MSLAECVQTLEALASAVSGRLRRRTPSGSSIGVSSGAGASDSLGTIGFGDDRMPSSASIGLGGDSRALDGLSDWYSHPSTNVFKITHLPEGYPNGFEFEAGSTPNTADYDGRGW